LIQCWPDGRSRTPAMEATMTFAQLLHRVLDHYLGDEAFERRQRRQVEKISDRLWDKI